MIKVLINNEEVVCNSNIQINEEMLSTSSTILKNCYPASWELDKDYTSRYYFPKDYSKCKIFNETVFPALDGETVQGTNLSIDYDDTLNYDYKFYGNNEQGETVTGLQTIDINGTDYEINLGKNLLDISDITTTSYITNNGDGSITLNGTGTGGISFSLSTPFVLKANTTYTLSLTNTNSSYSNATFVLRNGNTNIFQINYGQSSVSYTPTEDTTIDTLRIYAPNTITFNNFIFSIQLEKGTQATSYSSYFTPIELETDDYIYKDNGWYISKNGVATEITNETLISQLESIVLVNGTNTITSSSANLPIILYLHYNWREAYTTEDLLFCGCVKNTGNISLNPREPHYVDLQLLDFKCLLSEGETLDFVITNKTIREAIEQVVASISDYGFVVGNIEILNPNDIINAYSTLNKTPYDVFQYIADVSESRWFTRMIDENTIAIDFYDPTLMPKASDINHTKEYFEENKIDSIDFNYSTNDYRNKQIMTSDEVYANITQTETIIANGYQDSFMCQIKIGKITKITINGVSATFITKNEKELGLNGDFVYNPGEMTFTSNNILNAGDVIVIIYYPIVKGREIILNSNEVSRINNQINRKGTISRYESRKDATSSQELQKIGQSYIKYKGNAEITLKIVSENDLFSIGQIVSYNAPLEELTTDYMVKKKTIDMYINANKIFYTFELSSNFNYENEVNFFDNQRAKNQGNIGEGETIVRNIDIENTALIQFYETNIEEVETSNISTLDFSLDAVLI